MTAPTLRTDRLTLRPMAASDWPAFRDFFAGPRASYMGGPYDETGAWGMFCSDTAQWSLFGFGGLMIDAGDDTVGQVSIIDPPAWPQEELGWFLYDGHEGQGYATEAAAALRDWYYGEHPASASVARRLGAVLIPGLPVADDGDHVWLHPAPERLQ